MTGSIAQEVERIVSSVTLRGLDESATKQGVVLRLLSLAGWDVFDVSEVVPEYTVGNRRVDYALRPGSPNLVFIEVKRPGENLDGHQQQLLEYCFQEGVKLAALTNGRTWWLYLPLQAGGWEQRRFLTIDLEAQEPAVVEQSFMDYLSPERVVSGQAVRDAEDMVKSQARAEIIGEAIVKAWNCIVETPDELLVDLIAETTENICGCKPKPELVKQFLSRSVRASSDASHPTQEPPRGVLHTPAQVGGQRPTGSGQGPTLPITLEPAGPANFLAALLLTKKAWIEEFYTDGHSEILPWNAPYMKPSSNVFGNLRSRPKYRQGTWQRNGIAGLRVTIDRPRNADG